MARSFAHITPRYIGDRVAVMCYERFHPNDPWLTKEAVRFLGQWLRPTDVGLEFGSGRSSIWFIQHISHLTSIEDNPAWFERVTDLFSQKKLGGKIDLRFQQDKDPYVNEASKVADASIDFCLIDGSHRDECAVRVIPKIKSGGALIVDNVNWYLPSDSISPDSRTASQGCATPLWTEFASQVAGWRRYWSSSGVTDTCIWFKP